MTRIQLLRGSNLWSVPSERSMMIAALFLTGLHTKPPRLSLPMTSAPRVLLPLAAVSPRPVGVQESQLCLLSSHRCLSVCLPGPFCLGLYRRFAVLADATGPGGLVGSRLKNPRSSPIPIMRRSNLMNIPGLKGRQARLL